MANNAPRKSNQTKAVPARPTKGKNQPLKSRLRARPGSAARAPEATPKAPDRKEALGGANLNKILTPKNFEESIGTIVSLRGLSKQILKYVQQADNLMDTLFVTANSLHETGVLKKLAESKGKNLTSTDFTNILMALMNSPLGNNVFKRLSGGDGAAKPDDAKSTGAQDNAAPTPPPVQAPSGLAPLPSGAPAAKEGPGQSAVASLPTVRPQAPPPGDLYI